jgi:hypothetical protein
MVPAWQAVGATRAYHPASGLSAGPGPFDAEILGFTPGGKARIRAFDAASGEWHHATVNRGACIPDSTYDRKPFRTAAIGADCVAGNVRRHGVVR